MKRKLINTFILLLLCLRAFSQNNNDVITNGKHGADKIFLFNPTMQIVSIVLGLVLSALQLFISNKDLSKMLRIVGAICMIPLIEVIQQNTILAIIFIIAMLIISFLTGYLKK